MTDHVASAQHGFAEQYGRRPAGVWSAPGRVNLIGEHTDYNDGFVFPFAIDRRTTVALGDRDDRLVRVASTFSPDVVEVHLDELTPEAVTGWAAYPLGVVWALGESGADLQHVRGVDLHIDSDVPVGAGLSSSAAIECAVALALDDTPAPIGTRDAMRASKPRRRAPAAASACVQPCT